MKHRITPALQKNHPHRRHLICFLGLSLVALTPSFATVLFSENFDSYTTGTAINTAGPSNWAVAGNVQSVTADIVQTDSGNLFLAGTGNKMGQISQLAASSSLAQFSNNSENGSFGLTGQVSFDFVIPTAASVSPASAAYATTANSLDGIVFRIGNAQNAGGSAFGLLFKDTGLYRVSGSSLSNVSSQLAALTTGTKYSLSIVYNNSSSTFNYAGGSVVAQTMDIYLNGVLVGDNQIRGALAADTPLTSLGFIAKTNTTVLSMYTDNFLITDTVAIPEPHTVAVLFGFASLAAVLVLRRKRG